MGTQFLYILYWTPSSLSSLMGAPSDQFLLIQYGDPSQISSFAYFMPPTPSLRLVSLHAIGGPIQISFFTKYMETPSDQCFPLTI